MTPRFVSPKQLARAAGVSESSVKRWCDQGIIPTVKTAGGHRRLTLDAAAEFLRQSGLEVRAELLGLPVRDGLGEAAVRSAGDDFFEALIAGDEAACSRIALDRHVGGEAISHLCDAIVAPALHRVGDAWNCHDVDVYHERRGCTICLRVFETLRATIPSPARDAPLALGGSPECDPYMVPGTMVDLVLRQVGWRSQLLGPRLPFASLVAAARDLRPQLLWVSVSVIEDETRFLEEYREFYAAVQAETAVVVGGRALVESVRRRMSYAAFCDNLQHLESFARTLHRGLAAASRRTAKRASSRREHGVPKSEGKTAANAASGAKGRAPRNGKSFG